jgi:hypothetical protein
MRLCAQEVPVPRLLVIPVLGLLLATACDGFGGSSDVPPIPEVPADPPGDAVADLPDDVPADEVVPADVPADVCACAAPPPCCTNCRTSGEGRRCDVSGTDPWGYCLAGRCVPVGGQIQVLAPPSGGEAVQWIAVSPDGRYAAVAHAETDGTEGRTTIWPRASWPGPPRAAR